ncbi:hypothetical protein DXG03_003944 [Asterophora parasitica]|uniref:Uncharacterized protein n=1 Tax=Asterophora parasitica TaxID=117018 RepID=A0A9P7G127_9AGAR|nr:hypothetical protein DXG03_003944 [Asterophora parasitica]
MAVFSHIPQEIIDNIIDELACDSSSSLHTCSTTYRKFTARSQRHLLFRARIVFPSRAEDAQDLLRVLRPDLARHIRHISIINYVEFSNSAADADLQRVLQTLVFLHSFTLCMGIVDGGWIVRLSPAFTSCLVTMFALTQVVEINVHYVVDFPAQLMLYHCPHIRAVSFEQCFSTSTACIISLPFIPGLPTSQGPLFLDTLHLSSGALLQFARELNAAIKHPHSPFGINSSRLREIAMVGYAPKLISYVMDCMRFAGASLKVFSWDICHTDPADDVDGASKIVLRIQIIAKEIFLTHSTGTWEKALPPVGRFGPLGIPDSIETLHITFSFDTQRASSALQWLASTLSSNDFHPQLRQLVLVIGPKGFPSSINTVELTALWMTDMILMLKYQDLRQVLVYLMKADSATASEENRKWAVMRDTFIQCERQGKLKTQWLDIEALEPGMSVTLRALERGITLRDGHLGEDGEPVPVCRLRNMRSRKDA